MQNSSAINKIQSLSRFGSRLGLERMEILLNLLGNPQNDLKVIHVGGTNGKGSTCRFLNDVFMEAGYKTGLFTSPFLSDFKERIEVSGKEISESELETCSTVVFEKIREMERLGYDLPTEFEAITAISLVYFKSKDTDIVILEVGLGGRGDSTNIVKKPMISAITSIGYDHMDRLGDTLIEIAEEKAGIIKQDVPMVMNIADMEAKKVVLAKCAEKNAPVTDVSLMDARIENMGIRGSGFEILRGRWAGMYNISMLGEHQIENAKVALCILEIAEKQGFKLSESHVKAGMAKAFHKGRLEILKENPFIIVDGAHNRDGLKRLKESMDMYFPHKKILMLVGILKDKELKTMAEQMACIARDFIVTEPVSERLLEAEKLGASLQTLNKNVTIIKDCREAYKYGLDIMEKEKYDVFLICGSLYLIGEIREMIL